jgi:hypothetical protein
MRNVVFGNCLNQIWTVLSTTTILLLASATGFAQSSTRTASTVAVDARTGRLVRKVVVAPKVIPAKAVEPLAGRGVSGAGPDASIDELIEQSARSHGVDPLLVHSVIKTESNYNPNAISNKGAQGLMQLMPATARDLGVKDAMNPRENIEGGVKYLKYLQTKFSDPALALAAYNAGEGAVKRYNWIPPYPETQDYVVKVARNYREAKAAAAARQPVAQTDSQPRNSKAESVVAVQSKQEPQAASAAPTEPPPTPLQYYYDARGRLTLRTVR